MKTKALLRFYFAADKVERAIDNLILYEACAGSGFLKNCAACADRVIYLIDCKDELNALWAFLNGVIAPFGGDVLLLKRYAFSRAERDDRAVKRAVMRFRRHAAGVCRFKMAFDILAEYAVLCRGE